MGRWLGEFKAASRYYSVEVLHDETGAKAVGLKILEKEVQLTWAEHSQGAYLLRTNWNETDPAVIWKRYIQLTRIEDTFRISKSDLHFYARCFIKRQNVLRLTYWSVF